MYQSLDSSLPQCHHLVAQISDDLQLFFILHLGIEFVFIWTVWQQHALFAAIHIKVSNILLMAALQLYVCESYEFHCKRDSLFQRRETGTHCPVWFLQYLSGIFCSG